MSGRSYDTRGVRVFECPVDGTELKSDRDAVNVMNMALEHGASLVLIPTACLNADFFDLKTRIAGEVLQKFVTYHMRVAIVGDISHYMAESSTLRDFVHETNRGQEVWFVADRAELEKYLDA